jgi:prolyl oligopeptidase
MRSNFFVRRLAFVCAIVFLAFAGTAQSPAILPPPPTAKRPVTDVYDGVKVTDDYRWLEDWNHSEVKQWSAAQNARTREYLDHLASRPVIKQRLQLLISASSGHYFELDYSGGTLFAMKDQPPKQQAFLVALRSAEDLGSEKVVIDPNTLGGKGSVAIDFYVPSLDGKLVVASLSENGSEDGTAHVFDVATGKELSDRVPRVNFGTAGGSFAWNKDGSGFYYTGYPQGNDLFSQAGQQQQRGHLRSRQGFSAYR